MEFSFKFTYLATGKAGWAAPRLKDAALSEDRLREGYVEVYYNFSFYWCRI